MAKQPLIEWREGYSTGVPAVDYEHRELIALLNELYGHLLADADRYAIDDFLAEVQAKITAHFALEEKIMRDRRYDQYEDHKQDHERLLDEIGDIIDSFEDGDGFSAEDLGARLDRWFSAHFASKDARLHRCLGT